MHLTRAWHAVALAVGIGLAAGWSQQPQAAAAPARAAAAASFASPQAAAAALVAAAQAGDLVRLRTIFGPDSPQLLSGDPVADRRDLADFAGRTRAGMRLEPVDPRRYEMVVGKPGWPFAVPIVGNGTSWHFDTPAGAKEIAARRVGANELATMDTCRAYAQAQWQYFDDGPWGGSQVKQFAQKMVSAPGRQDGLYWPTAPHQPPSPLGPLVAQAQAAGYRLYGGQAATAVPYQGYYFRILKAQGPSAPGGAHTYVINRLMIAGFALVAYPARYGKSGVMTFIVGPQGRVYQKDLGPETAQLAGAMTQYNPGSGWQAAQPQ